MVLERREINHLYLLATILAQKSVSFVRDQLCKYGNIQGLNTSKVSIVVELHKGNGPNVVDEIIYLW
ncbi:uncharacterized protein G2W53_034850 [Senna tora]|uniref:Uncharacterized protein n=1 Tax=Senna tora TaxID=362788 RepID=A0A834WE47_9FABA|nr:uncharacterized protein G2W53_034850 [Senna tora]